MGDQRGPRIILLGSGVADRLQITIEAQRVLSRVGKVYALRAPVSLRRYLKSLRVECVDLSGRFRAGRPFSDVYLEIADLILARTSEEPTVVLLTPGNPLFLNSISRFLVQEARQRKLPVQVHPGVSELDALLCYLGLDVSSFGLQMFDARQLVARRQVINPGVPLLILQTDGLSAGDVVSNGSGEMQDYGPLAEHLSRFYPAGHPVSVVNVAPSAGQPAHVTASLDEFSKLVPYIGAQSNLFIDRVRVKEAGKAAARKTEVQSDG